MDGPGFYIAESGKNSISLIFLEKRALSTRQQLSHQQSAWHCSGTVVGMTGEQAPDPVQLLGQNDAYDGVGKGQGRQ